MDDFLLNTPNLLASPASAIIKITTPTKINDVWIPTSTEIAPNKSIPTTSHNLAVNSPTPDIVPSSSGFVQSEMKAEITGRIRERPNDIANVMVIMLRNHSLYPSNI